MARRTKPIRRLEKGPTKFFLVCDECAKANRGVLNHVDIWYDYDTCALCKMDKSVSHSDWWKGLEDVDAN